MPILDGASTDAVYLLRNNIVDQDSTSLHNVPNDQPKFPAAAVTANDATQSGKISAKESQARVVANVIGGGTAPGVVSGSIKKGF